MPQARPSASRILIASLVAALAFQLFVLYTPGSPEPSRFNFPGMDKLIHIVIFAAPAYLAWRLASRWWPIILLAVHVPISELIQQAWIPYRGGDWMDAVADLAGVALGTLLAQLRRRR